MNLEELDNVFKDHLANAPFDPDDSLKDVVFQKINSGLQPTPQQKLLKLIASKPVILSSIVSIVTGATVLYYSTDYSNDADKQLTSSAQVTELPVNTTSSLAKQEVTVPLKYAAREMPISSMLYEKEEEYLQAQKQINEPKQPGVQSKIIATTFKTNQPKKPVSSVALSNAGELKYEDEKAKGTDLKGPALSSSKRGGFKSGDLPEKTKLNDIGKPGEIPQHTERSLFSKLMLTPISPLLQPDYTHLSTQVPLVELSLPKKDDYTNLIGVQWKIPVAFKYRATSQAAFPGLFTELDTIPFFFDQEIMDLELLPFLRYTVKQELTQQAAFNLSLNYQRTIRSAFFVQGKLDLGKTKLQLKESYWTNANYESFYVYDFDGITILDTFSTVQYNGEERLLMTSQSNMDVQHLGLNIGIGKVFSLGDHFSISPALNTALYRHQLSGLKEMPFYLFEPMVYTIISDKKHTVHSSVDLECRYQRGKFGLSLAGTLDRQWGAVTLGQGTLPQKRFGLYTGVGAFYLF